MERKVLEAIRSLLQETRVLSLAVLVDGDPEAALLPCPRREDYGVLDVPASALARHARGLQSGTRVGVLVHASDTADADPRCRSGNDAASAGFQPLRAHARPAPLRGRIRTSLQCRP